MNAGSGTLAGWADAMASSPAGQVLMLAAVVLLAGVWVRVMRR